MGSTSRDTAIEIDTEQLGVRAAAVLQLQSIDLPEQLADPQWQAAGARSVRQWERGGRRHGSFDRATDPAIKRAQTQ